MNYTSIEQSKKLLELGLNPDSADMHIAYTDTRNYVGLGNPPCEVTFGSPDEKAEIIPCWSVGALFDVLPELIGVHFKTISCLYGYHCAYMNGNGEIMENDTKSDSLIGAIYEMAVRLLESGQIK